MPPIKSVEDLKAYITLLEVQHAIDKQLVIQDFSVLKEDLKPINIIKNTVNNLAETLKLEDIIISSTLLIGSKLLNKTISSIISSIAHKRSKNNS